MKLLRLKADGFGPLRGEWVFDPGKLTLIVDDNERGKSSLLAAVTAGLYGLEDDRRSHRLVTPLEHWRPWDGGAYRVELEVEDEGRRLTIKRDFGQGKIEVWSDRGQEVTEEFRAGRDEYPVGQKLLGLDVAEFEKCALVRQYELDAVVPGDEKVRRLSTLHARLENAADTRVGDTNATEALQVLTAAAANYTCRELDSTLSADNAIKRLEVMTGLLETEVKELEHDYAQIAGPLDELASLAEAEKDARAAIARLENQRRETLAGEARRQLELNAERQAELEKLRAEAAQLALAADLPANAEADLREAVAKHEEAMSSLATLEARRREEQARERAGLVAEGESLGTYALCTAEDADRAAALAAELRWIADEDQKLRTEVFGLRDSLAVKGYEPERVQQLTGRFEDLDEESIRLLRSQSELALAFQTEVADLERVRTESTEMLRAIDAVRNSRRVPGWILLTLGLGATAGGSLMIGLRLDMTMTAAMLAAGAVLLVTGGALLATATTTRRADRELALRQLSEAQRRINQLRSQRAETEVGLGELSRTMGYRDPVELMRDWGEYTRMCEESSPVLNAQQQLASLDKRRRAATEEAGRLLERAGGGTAEPARLEEVAAGIRRLVAVRQKMAETDKSWSWIDDEKKVAEAAAAGLKDRAVKILQGAGLPYDPGQPWAPQVQALAQRARGRERHALLKNELIPQAERRVLPEKSRLELESQLKMLEAQEGEEPAPTTDIGAAEIEVESRRHREALDHVLQKRGDLRERIQGIHARYHQQHPEKVENLRLSRQALARAKRFKQAIEIARETIQSVAQETHRRWADHLNARVAELLAGVGAGIEQVRFGDDLDFSVTVGGQQMARGRAVTQLSAGARDQLLLAVRLAVSEYLSRGRAPLPLLIDDAFATSDDGRARRVMKTLLDHFSRRHQIVLATCHRRRIQSIAEEERALFDERVHWLELGAAKAGKTA